MANPRTPIERAMNKQTLLLARKIRQEREQELLEDKSGYRLKKDRKIYFLEYFQTYINEYTKKDIRMVKIAFQRFKDFLSDTPKYKMYVSSIQADQIDKDIRGYHGTCLIEKP